MNIIISNNSSTPIYEQIKIAIKQAIFSNELKEDILPSVMSMANDLKISFLTVKKAYDELEQEGFIKTNYKIKKRAIIIISFRGR